MKGSKSTPGPGSLSHSRSSACSRVLCFRSRCLRVRNVAAALSDATAYDPHRGRFA